MLQTASRWSSGFFGGGLSHLRMMWLKLAAWNYYPTQHINLKKSNPRTHWSSPKKSPINPNVKTSHSAFRGGCLPSHCWQSRWRQLFFFGTVANLVQCCRVASCPCGRGSTGVRTWRNRSQSSWSRQPVEHSHLRRLPGCADVGDWRAHTAAWHSAWTHSLRSVSD